MSTALWIVMLLALTLGKASAQPVEGADVTLPGAEGQLGWGGGYSSGAWSLLRVRATGGDAYSLTLETQSGTLRSGLQPLSATLTVGAGAGVREQHLWLPLFTKRPVKLTLTSSLGKSSATVQPLNADGIVTEPMDSPAAYLGKPRVAGILEPQSALIALAGGAVLTNANGLERLPSGSLGLGALRRAATQSPRLDLEGIALSAMRAAQPPPRQSEGLAWWCAAAFAAALGVYSARRLEWRFAVWGAALMLGIGATGWVALRASSLASSTTNAEQTVLIGAGGWGLKMQITSRFNATASPLSLPSGVRPISGAQSFSPMSTHYTQSATLIQTAAWTNVSYWSAPSAARVPLRVKAGTLENSGPEALSDVYVIGTGPLEPIRPSAKRSIKTINTSRIEDGYSSYGSLVRHLPLGSALARRGQTLVIALPELSERR